MNVCGKKPHWLKVKLPHTPQFSSTRRIIEEHCLHTICSSGQCPNRSECWERGVATFMIAGEVCTRGCRFCATATGKPSPLDPFEPSQIVEAIKLLKLRHAVITSVTRDDLHDGGAAHWAETIKLIKESLPEVIIEVLIPDFSGNTEQLDQIVAAQPHIVGHNLETIRRITPKIRSGANYERSLFVLKYLTQQGCLVKSGMMVGLGETPQEVSDAMSDLRQSGVSLLTIGQYLQPARQNIAVYEYVSPYQFDIYKKEAIALGFTRAECAPKVRSSYYADHMIMDK